MSRTRKTFSMRFLVGFCLIVFLIITVTFILVALLVGVLLHFGLFLDPSPSAFFLYTALLSVILCTLMARFAGRAFFAPIEKLTNAMEQVAKGSYDIRLKQTGRIREVRQMTESFNIMATALSTTEMLRSDFIRNVSHEFKSPLASIEGYSTLLQNEALTPAQRAEYTKKIVANTKRLSRLTGNILALSQLETQDAPLVKAPFRLDEQLRQAALLYETQWEEKNIAPEIDAEEIAYDGNEALLFEVWQNLIGNAVKFGDANSALQISAHAQDGRVVVSVTNTGAEIPEVDYDRIFEKFYQGDLTRHAEGNGLGLALVKQIVTLHEGDVGVVSEDGKTTFTVRL